MCYTGVCEHERYGGPDKGECCRPGNIECPFLALTTGPLTTSTATEAEFRHLEFVKRWNADVAILNKHMEAKKWG